ncbi:glycosyltransferase [uncultured Helicobacter sp.]|uniref:glycosyltransferase n=1 Tax=uncultured Helicobacter sp. TaxID=175537 RepID=UPI002619BF7D|nr:glycosyltransferase [uncultured Helicobacter sp.]
MKPIRILLAIRSLNFGGAERQWVLLAKEIAKHPEVELRLCTLYGGGRLEYEITGISHICLHKKGRSDISFLSAYRKVIKDFRPHCIYAFMPEMNIFSLICSAFLGTKVIFGFRSSSIEVNKLSLASKLYFYTQRLLSRFADAIVCNSYDALRFYQSKGYYMKKALVVYNGIDTTRFNRRDIKRFKKELGIAENIFVFGIVARMDKVKDYPLFARVAKEFIEQSKVQGESEVAFIALGKCEEKILKDCLNILGETQHKVLFLGAKNDVEAYYPLFDCILSTSYTESFSNSIAEGMACGCVPIVSDVGESKIIANFGQDSYSFFFPPKEEKSALKCLESLYALRNSNQLESLKAQSRAQIVEKFSVDSMVSTTLKILTSLAQSVSVEILKVELHNNEMKSPKD